MPHTVRVASVQNWRVNVWRNHTLKNLNDSYGTETHRLLVTTM